MIKDYLKKLYNKDFEFKLAFNHSSYANLHSLESNEKLEFLGDSIIGFYVSKFLFEKKLDEGKLSKMRAKMVSTKNFAKICDELELCHELKIIGEISEKIKANLFEAVVAEIYLNLTNKNDIFKFIKPLVIDEFEKEKFDDFKTLLQEKLQKQKNYKIDYKTSTAKNGFNCKVYNLGKIIGSGFGANKKKAEQDAAKDALEKLSKKEK